MNPDIWVWLGDVTYVDMLGIEIEKSLLFHKSEGMSEMEYL